MDFELDQVTFQNGDVVTIQGLFRRIPNCDRRWWQFWKPRVIVSSELQQFRVAPFR